MEPTRRGLPAEVWTVVDWWKLRVRALLGEAMVGARLTGSSVVGGFEARWSDVDALVMLKHAISDDQAECLRRLHEDMEQRFLREGTADWRSTQLFECPYVPVYVAAKNRARARVLNVGTGYSRIEICDPVPGFRRYVLARYSVPIEGKAPAFVPPTQEDLVADQQWLLDLLARPSDEHSPVMLAGLVHEAARSELFWRTGQYLGKTEALNRAVTARDELSKACDIARRIREVGSAHAHKFRNELEPEYRKFAPAVLERLRYLMERATIDL